MGRKTGNTIVEKLKSLIAALLGQKDDDFPVVAAGRTGVASPGNIRKVERYKFEPDQGISGSIIANTGMVKEFGSFASFNLISGRYYDTDFYMSDVIIKADRQICGETDTLFSGTWMYFRLADAFPCNLQIFSRDMDCARPRSGYGSIDCLNSSFYAYTNYSKKERQLLTPGLISMLGRLSEAYTIPTMIIMMNGCVHVALDEEKAESEHHTEADKKLIKQRLLKIGDTIWGFKALYTDFQ